MHSTEAISAPPVRLQLPPARPITNASRNIKFSMLQPHFERPLQEAALKFGVCTTLLKKICRKNGIANWPFRKICGLRKSIASMEKQVQYFDGEQKQSYADQLHKLQIELEAYRQIGTAPTPEFIQRMNRDAQLSQAVKDERSSPNVATLDDASIVEPMVQRPAGVHIDNDLVQQLSSSATIAQMDQGYGDGYTQHIRPRMYFNPGEYAYHNQQRPSRLHPPRRSTIAVHQQVLPSINVMLYRQNQSSVDDATLRQPSCQQYAGEYDNFAL